MATKHSTEYYSIPKGKLLFRKDSEAHWEDLGNCTKLEVAEEIEQKEHFSSRTGLKNRDQLINLSYKASGSFSLDSLHMDNLQKYYMADSVAASQQAAAVGATKTIAACARNRWHEFGKYDVSNVVVKDVTDTIIYTPGDDYEVDAKGGLLFVLSTGAIGDGDELHLTFDHALVDIEKIQAGTSKTLQGHFKFVADPGIGPINDLQGFGTLTPEGNHASISDEYVPIDMKVEFLEHTDYAPGVLDVTKRGIVAAS